MNTPPIPTAPRVQSTETEAFVDRLLDGGPVPATPVDLAAVLARTPREAPVVADPAIALCQRLETQEGPSQARALWEAAVALLPAEADETEEDAGYYEDVYSDDEREVDLNHDEDELR